MRPCALLGWFLGQAGGWSWALLIRKSLCSRRSESRASRAPVNGEWVLEPFRRVWASEVLGPGPGSHRLVTSVGCRSHPPRQHCCPVHPALLHPKAPSSPAALSTPSQTRSQRNHVPVESGSFRATAEFGVGWCFIYIYIFSFFFKEEVGMESLAVRGRYQVP